MFQVMPGVEDRRLIVPGRDDGSAGALLCAIRFVCVASVRQRALATGLLGRSVEGFPTETSKDSTIHSFVSHFSFVPACEEPSQLRKTVKHGFRSGRERAS